MKTTLYEDTYYLVKEAQRYKTIKYVDEVAAFLKEQTKPMSCGEIGKALWGDNYNNNKRLAPSSAGLARILSNLVHSYYVCAGSREGKPIEVEVEEWIPLDITGAPLYITVHDDEGNTYKMKNPGAKSTGGGRWGKVKKTIVPTITVYAWVSR